MVPDMGVETRRGYGIMCLSILRRWLLTNSDPDDDKLRALRRHHALNPRPEAVRDPAFTSGDPFFDGRDLVQVKYEMLRSVREGRPASRAAQDFGFSRPSLYQARNLFEVGGLPALLPQRPGPKRAHKLSEDVLDFLEAELAKDATLNATRLAHILQERRGLKVHPRTIERGLERRSKKALGRRA